MRLFITGVLAVVILAGHAQEQVRMFVGMYILIRMLHIGLHYKQQ